MKMPTYNSTLGLEQYPKEERYQVYKSFHNRLMSTDATYKRRWMSYLTFVVTAAIAPVPVLFFGGLIGVVVFFALLAIAVPVILKLAARQQVFMNERIGREIVAQKSA